MGCRAGWDVVSAPRQEIGLICTGMEDVGGREILGGEVDRGGWVGLGAERAAEESCLGWRGGDGMEGWLIYGVLSGCLLACERFA